MNFLSPYRMLVTAKVNSSVQLPCHALEAAFHISLPRSSGSFSSCWCSPRLGRDDTYAPFMEEHPLVTLVDLSLLYATNVLQSCPDLYPYHTACPSCPFHSQSHCIRTWCLYSQYFGTTIDLLSSRTNGLREGLLCFASVFEMACHSALFFLWHFIILSFNTPGLLFCASFNGLTPHHLFEICLLPKVPSFFILALFSNSF